MAWKNLSGELDELFGQLTDRTEEMGDALDARRERWKTYQREWEKTRNKKAERKAYKNAWARADRLERGLKRPAKSGARVAGWAGLSAEQKERHNELRRQRRARAKLRG